MPAAFAPDQTDDQPISHELARLLAGGVRFLGEVTFFQTGNSGGDCRGYEIRHTQDAGRADLTLYNEPEAAIEIAKYDAAGAYRPLKSAPGLRRGWRLVLPDVPALLLALDFLYPAMIGTWLAHEKGRLAPVSLRETVNRQTGMYRVTGKITTGQAQTLLGTVCAADRCLKTILWPVESTIPVSTLPTAQRQIARESARLPLLCQEPCNILVAAARECVKSAASSSA